MIDLIIIGKINHVYTVNNDIGVWGCCLNMISILTILAFIFILIVEIRYLFKNKADVKKRKFFSIGVIYMLVSVVLSFILIKKTLTFHHS